MAKKQRLTAAEKEKIVRLCESGELSPSEAARRSGVGKTAVST